ncbi:M23 family metallopeptidase [Shimia sagamensis]|uniref:Murein DD-endopeptidase MepM and murein hydrolase activator NlpD, contain LysM domain n=1 Tax=Shimia sagamensis TaxID=1566352 RepID=A0ABY1NJZ8_9RHOB|nr:M23 family metallopeptidase [Shimia sagamensis]SMP11068.1 Murein DD-endopeptidase MepM and murein hydrolase activator NlpD, contain LysM domain [Shimia sagamensis]
MRTRLAIRVHAILERFFPERRLFLRSDTDTRFIRLKPSTQLIAFVGSSAIVAWAIIATAILLMDSIGSGNFREQAKRDQLTYEQRLNDLSSERDTRTEEALAAQSRFNSALTQISDMQSELLASEIRRKELETGIEVIQSTLRRTIQEREAARDEVVARDQAQAETQTALIGSSPLGNDMLDVLSTALNETAAERDEVVADAQLALRAAEEMERELLLMEEKNDKIFRQLEDAMTVSVEPLTKMFTAAGLDTKNLMDEVRRGYQGQGGPMMPLSFSTKGVEISAETLRANRLLEQLDQLNVYRIAAETVPFDNPIKSAFRYTSGYGMRWGRMHKGTDFAARYGTPIYATADGVVTHAGWLSGYGRLVKIKHDHGIETRYAHQAKIRVKVGQRVSRGDHIGDMGNSGRSTGTHLHYEVRVNGRAVNPMTFIKAGRDVF